MEETNEVTLEDIATIFLDDPTVESQITNDGLTYVLPDGTQGEMIEYFDQYGRHVIEVSEGDEVSEIIFDPINNEVLLDGEFVTFYESEVFILEQINAITPRSTQWRLMFVVNHNMQAERRVRDMTTGALIILVGRFHPGASLTIGIAQLIINDFRARRPEHRSVYARRRMYDSPRVAGDWRYVDSYYIWNARTLQQRSATRTIFLHNQH